jgi:pheromone shutdown protein TraB
MKMMVEVNSKKSVVNEWKEKEVVLVGTLHVSNESKRRVEEAVRVHMPDMVCLELDVSRFKALLAREKEKKSGVEKGERGQFRYSGTAFGLGNLLQWIQMKIGEDLGVLPGSEMMVAVAVAREYKLPLGLIDQPAQTTVNRMWGKMPFAEKMRFLSQLGLASGLYFLKPVLGERIMSWFVEDDGINLGALEKGEGLNDVMEKFKEGFPTVYRVLVSERNAYMSRNLIKILSDKSRVVVVVGLGHVEGMKKLLESQGLRVLVV